MRIEVERIVGSGLTVLGVVMVFAGEGWSSLRWLFLAGTLVCCVAAAAIGIHLVWRGGRW